MQGSLCLRNGVLYVGRHEKTAHVRPFDLDGHPLGPGFSFTEPEAAADASVAGRASVGGLAVDGNHAIWVADPACSRLRAFTLFGKEVRSWGKRLDEGPDAAGSLADVTDVTICGEGDDPALLIACRGRRRHAVQMLSPDGTWQDSLRCQGDPQQRFRDVRRIAARGNTVWVCESGGGRVQVFRDGDFHFQFQVPAVSGAVFEPRALAALEDGSAVVAIGGQSSALVMVDAGGRFARVLVEHGREDGRVFEPNDLVVDEGGAGGRRRLAVIDCDGERVQVFTLEGRCFGSFQILPEGEA